MADLGKLMIFGGLALVAAGVLVSLFGRVGGGLLPGDILVRRGNTTFFFPVVTMLVLSVVATVVINLLIRR